MVCLVFCLHVVVVVLNSVSKEDEVCLEVVLRIHVDFCKRGVLNTNVIVSSMSRGKSRY